ncbi:MAG: hypothetical protein RTU92_15110 [Candidatus Thorarchaeota archaeon]
MVKLEFLLATIVGLGLFLTDFIFGWLTFLCGSIPVIFIMALIIGLIAGSHSGAIFATMITWIGGIGIGILITPLVFADFVTPETNILGLFLFVFIYSVRGVFDISFEGNIIEVIVVGIGMLIVVLVLTPVLYLFSFAFAPIGVVIGNFIRKRVGERSVEQPSFVQETPVIQPTPVEEEPSKVEETIEAEEEYSDNE